jgi:hypothetical protein
LWLEKCGKHTKISGNRMEEHVWYLIEKFISGDISSAEMKELQSLLALYP